MIKVLIVNDSIMTQQGLKRIVQSDPELEVLGIACDGVEGAQMVSSKNPDVVLMDIRMPNLNGPGSVKKIMATNPKPILIVTATLGAHMTPIFDCLNFGALEVIKTPAIGSGDTPEEVRKRGSELLKRIKIVANLKNVSAPKVLPEMSKVIPAQQSRIEDRPLDPKSANLARKVVAIGASTGGPTALLQVLQQIPKNIEAGLILVQHIDAEFSAGLVEWLDTHCAFPVYSAQEKDFVVRSTAFLAAEDKDLIVKSNFSMQYVDSLKGTFNTPSINRAFTSLASVYGENVVGVLLTGMGADGALGLKAIRDAGGHTIAQDEATSLIYGMPRAAKELGAAEYVLPLQKIGDMIGKLLT